MVSLELKRLVVSDFKSKRFTVAQIASRHGVSTTAVYKWVKEDAKDEFGESMGGKVSRLGKISGDIGRAVVELYESGSGITLIGKTVGLSPTAVKKHLEKEGIYKGVEGAKDRMTKLSDKDIDGIINDYCNTDMTVYDISGKYGITESYTRQILWKNNIKAQSKTRKSVLSSPKHQIKDEVIKLYKSGVLSHSDLASKFGVSTRTISRILKEAGIEAVRVKPSVPVTKVLEIKESVMQDMDNGLDLYALAEKYGVQIGVIESITSGAKTSESTVDSKAEQIMAEYNNGLSIKDIAQECRVALSTVYRVLKLNGVNIKEKRAGTEQVVEVTEDVSRIAELHSQGLILKDIAKEADISVYLVKKILEELGLEQNSPSDKHRPCVVELCKQGMSADSIASQVGLSVPTVRKILHEEGLTPSKGDNEVKKRVLKLFNQGMKAPQIASECGISAPTVRKIIATSGQVKDLNERIVELYDGGMEIEQIAQEVGLNRPLVMIELSKAMKAGTLYRPFFPESDISVIKHLASKWTTPDKIASHLGCDENYIRRFLQLPDKKI